MTVDTLRWWGSGVFVESWDGRKSLVGKPLISPPATPKMRDNCMSRYFRHAILLMFTNWGFITEAATKTRDDHTLAA
jgi:hypothetical protein